MDVIVAAVDEILVRLPFVVEYDVPCSVREEDYLFYELLPTVSAICDDLGIYELSIIVLATKIYVAIAVDQVRH